MGPTLDKVYAEAYQPYAENKIAFDEALKRGEQPMRAFMLKQTRQSRRAAVRQAGQARPGDVKAEDVPFKVLVPAFVTSELKSAFQIGFLIFIPFLIIDMIVASVLMSPGHDDAVAGADRAAVQADAVRAGRRLEPAARLAGRELLHLTTPTRAPMDAQQVFTLGQQGLYMLLMVSAPVLLTVLVVGLVVSVFQAATQINEATLSFVPKIVARRRGARDRRARGC